MRGWCNPKHCILPLVRDNHGDSGEAWSGAWSPPRRHAFCRRGQMDCSREPRRPLSSGATANRWAQGVPRERAEAWLCALPAVDSVQTAPRTPRARVRPDGSLLFGIVPLVSPGTWPYSPMHPLSSFDIYHLFKSFFPSQVY